ncbi:MAG: Rrf2 family transcriptional regulator [Acidobacteria bacterium]|nr:Rrf2 family transcriptional regulator [Acidobacteriota bacterium]
MMFSSTLLDRMLGKTSLSAIRALLLLGQKGADENWSPRRVAEELGESPTYMAKIFRQLVKAGILEAERGAKGGVRLARPKEEITLLDVVQACQGIIVGSYCRSSRPRSADCNFHLAALELHEAVGRVLERWTLAALLEKTHAGGPREDGVPCLMTGDKNPFLPLAELVGVGRGGKRRRR